jgi:hypothetical protein
VPVPALIDFKCAIGHSVFLLRNLLRVVGSIIPP